MYANIVSDTDRLSGEIETLTRRLSEHRRDKGARQRHANSFLKQLLMFKQDELSNLDRGASPKSAVAFNGAAQLHARRGLRS